MISKIKMCFGYIIYAIHIYLYRISDRRSVINADMERWSQECSIVRYSKTKLLIYLLMSYPQFRNLFYHRIRPRFNFIKKLCPPCSQLQIAADGNDIAGGGLYFEHAHATHIAAKSIGKGCIIRNLTTIGVKSKNRHQEKPTIGENVDFGVGVICIGNIHIGDNAIIAAGSVVVKDVPANAIVAGNPAKVIRFRDSSYLN